MNLETTYDLIEGYLNNTLSAAQHAEVEAKLQNDPSFFAEVESHRAVNNIISDNAALDIKKKLQQIHAENISKPGSGNLYYGVAAVIVALSIVAALIFSNKKEEVKVADMPSTESSESTSPANNITPNNGSVENNSAMPEQGVKKKNIDEVKENSKVKLQGHADNVIAEGAWNESKGNKLPEYFPGKANETKNETPKPENLPIVIPSELSKCEGVMIDVRYSTISTCAGQKNGAIVFDEGSGYEFSIDDGKTFSADSRFDKLGIGSYSLVIKDQNGCKSKPVAAQVEKEKCDYIVIPSRQQYWEVSLQKFAGESVVLKITDIKIGRVVFNETISGGSYTWTGMDENGAELPMGVYTYEISSPVNGDLPVIKGTVTIAR